MIPEAAVEAAAEAQVRAHGAWDWDALSAGERRGILAEVRVGLEAAAPHMARTIASMQELDALAVGSVLIDAAGDLYRRIDDDFAPWSDCEGGAYRVVELPAKLLHVPE